MRKKIIFLIALLVCIGLACNLTPGMATPAGSTPAPDMPAFTEVPPTETLLLPSNTPTAFPSYERFLCGNKPTVVALVADPGLASAVRPGLDQFAADLCADGYSVVERTLDFASPPEVRAYLADLYERTAQKLEGAIFIGDVPLPHQFFLEYTGTGDTPPIKREAISFQYYSDLDGEFTASPGFSSPGRFEYSYDQHTGEVDWEIWTAVLPLFRGDPAQTAEALARFFEKDHRYRTGGYDIPKTFVVISEHFVAKTDAEQANFINLLRTGTYSWTPLSSQPSTRIYIQGTTISVKDGYADLSTGVGDITVTEVHGNWESSGTIDIRWVESQPVRTVLFWSDGCSIGNLEHAENFLTSVIYSPASMVLIAKGSTNDSGGLGSNREGYYGHNIAVRLAAGKNLGQAILGHMNVPLISPWAESREFHFSMLLLIGDPTLRLRS